jgi:hypothetical protein
VLPAPLANCFPSDDAEFTAAVAEALARSAELPIPNEELLERLEDALRDQYPLVRGTRPHGLVCLPRWSSRESRGRRVGRDRIGLTRPRLANEFRAADRLALRRAG